MDSYVPPSSDNQMWYGAIATGKRIPEIYTLSPNLDRNGDNIINSDDYNLLYKRVGPDGHLNYSKGIINSISIMKISIILILFGIAQLGLYSGTFGCKADYLQVRWGWTAQLVLFCVILVNMIIEVENTRNDATTIGVIIAAFAVWLLLNTIAKIGDTWLVFASPFWPTPLTYWGVTMLMGVVIFALDQHRTYWLKSKDQSNMDKATRQATWYANSEYILIIAFLTITIWRFSSEYLKEVQRLGKRFNFIKFFVGTKTHDKIDKIKAGDKIRPGLCKEQTKKQLKKEIRLGIKNSPWTKFKNSIYNGLN